MPVIGSSLLATRRWHAGEDHEHPEDISATTPVWEETAETYLGVKANDTLAKVPACFEVDLRVILAWRTSLQDTPGCRRISAAEGETEDALGT